MSRAPRKESVIATHIGKPELEQLEVEDYATVRPKIKSGDIFFCAGHYFVSKAIQKLTSRVLREKEMSKMISMLLLVSLAAVLTGGCPSLNTGAGSSAGGGATTSDAQRILDLVNAERAGQGLSSLARNTQLDTAAEAHAADMRDNNFFAHTGSSGTSVGDRATAAGYVWTKIGENIGMGSISAQDMMDQWMNSPGHRANILDGDFTEIGIGINDSGTTLWVQVFGRP